MEKTYNYQENNSIPKCSNFNFTDDYRRENFFNSNLSTSLSSYDKNNNEKKNIFKIMKQGKDNRIINTNIRYRSRSPCLCGCHSNEGCLYAPRCHYVQLNNNEQCFITTNNNSFVSKDDEMNKKNDKLFNEIIYLKRNIRKLENDLDRIRTEKDASDFYIKELEKELFRLNMFNNSQIDNSNLKDSNKKVKMRDFGRYYDMLNRSFEVLDSISNHCNDSNGRTKGGINYYFNRNQEYNIVIDSQKKWIDNLPYIIEKNNGNYTENIPLNTNKFGNNNYNLIDNDRLNIIKYPDGYNDIKVLNNNNKDQPSYDNNNKFEIKRNNYLPNYINNIDNKGENPNKKVLPNIDKNSYSDSYLNQTKEKMNKNSYDKHLPNENNKNNLKYNNQKNNIIPKPYPKKINNNNNNINNKNYKPIKNNKNNQYDNKDEYMNSMNDKIKIKKDEEEGLENNNNINENNKPLHSQINERFLVTDNQGNPIYIEGNRLLAMEIIPILGENGKEEIDDNGNILFIGPDGQPKTQDDLDPIILDNDKPLVNEENKPFLGINGVIMVNKSGNPIVGPGELYDKNNKVVHGELGILPKDNQGNLIKINDNNEKPLLNNFNNNNNYNDYDNNMEDNNDYNIINDDNNNKNNDNDNNNINDYPKKISNKKDSNINNNISNPNINDDNNNMNLNEKENNNNENDLNSLIRSEERPDLDKRDNPILLDKKDNPIKDKGVSILLDQFGKPILNTIGEPIVINKEGRPINLIDNKKTNIPNNNKRVLNYQKIKPNNKKKNKNERIISNDNKEERKYEFNEENKNKNDFAYPKPNPNYQRKNNYKPVLNIKNIDTDKDKEYFSNSTCFACDVGCGVSRSGYSPMTYSPFDNSIKRRESTPLKDNIEYYEYLSK